jgi:hypothetical protein
MALQLPQTPSIPRSDFSWMDSIGDTLGGAIDKKSRDLSLSRLADMSVGSPPSSQGGFLSSLTGPQQTQTAPVVPVSRSALQGDTYKPFIDTVRSGGLTNPYGLAAVASTGKAESGWSAKNAMRTWSDPSESGQAGTAGGILSWRGPRYQALAATGDLSPEGQAKFFLQENPQLIQALNNAGSVEEAQQLMNRAWAFAGYNRPGGESARRLAMAKSYYSNEFGNAPANAGAAAIEAVTPIEQGDTSGSETAYVDPMVKVEPRTDAAPYTMASPTAPSPAAAPMQVADSTGAASNMIAQGVSPVQRGGVDPSVIRQLLKDPQLNSIGLELWKANVQGQKASEPWQFVNLPDGTLARANQQTGAVERLGNFAKTDRQGLVNAGNGVLYDPNNKEWITSPSAGQQFRQATSEEANKYGAQAGQFGPDGKFYPINPPSGTSLQVDPATGAVTFNQGAGVKPLTEGQSKDTVYATRATNAMPLLNQHEGALLNLGETLANGIPMNLGNYAQSEEYQLARDAGKDFLASILRKDTGAAVTKSEEDLYGRIFLPQPGDKPATVESKRQRRAIAVEAIKAGMPPAAIQNMAKALGTAENPANGSNNNPPPATNTAAPRARNPQTGKVIELRNGKWEEVP